MTETIQLGAARLATLAERRGHPAAATCEVPDPEGEPMRDGLPDFARQRDIPMGTAQASSDRIDGEPR